MKPVLVVCSSLVLASIVVLAQSVSAPLIHQVNGMRVNSSRIAKPQVQTGPEQVLYSFQGGKDGSSPSGPLIFDSSGNLYGSTVSGGGTACNGGAGCGTVFGLHPNGSGGWTETVLYSFKGGSSDGSGGGGGLIFDHAGNLYGTTSLGGAYNQGTAFELSPDGKGEWTETILYSFGAYIGDAANPSGGLIFDKSGNLYGTASGGTYTCGKFGTCGTVFELSPNGSGGWTETMLYSFQGGVLDGDGPNSPLIFDQAGNLYGTTSLGGNSQSQCAYPDLADGCGTVFELGPNGSGGWAEKLIYNFQGVSGDGSSPNGGLVFDKSGNLYGTTIYGGVFTGQCTSGPPGGCGTIFELSPTGSGGWTEAILYKYQDSPDGAYPSGALIFDQAGNLDGTTGQGGGVNSGTVFGLGPSGAGGWTETVLYSFQGNANSDGSSPSSAVILDQLGHLYGTTKEGGADCVADGGCGTVFEVTKEPFATPSPTSLNLGNQNVATASSPQVVTLTNSGGLPLTITSIQITGANSGDFAQTNDCPSSLAPSNDCKISVTFTPMAVGNANASVTVTDNAPGSPQSVPLTGTGMGGAVGLSPSSVSFPSQDVGTSGLPQSVMLTNTGNAVLTITRVTASPKDFGVLNACGSTVTSGSGCSIGVFFDPTTSGTRNGVLTVVDSATGSPQTVPLSGVGEDFSVAASSSSSATVTPGQTANYTVTAAPVGGFKQIVTLSCSGAPPLSTCALSSGSVALNGSTPASVNVTVTTTGTSASLAHPAVLPPASSKLALWLAVPGLSGLALLGTSCDRSSKRVVRRLYVLVLLCVLSFGISWSACGGGSSSGSGGGGGGTPAGTYNLTVTGTFTSGSTTLTHNTKLTLVVQ